MVRISGWLRWRDRQHALVVNKAWSTLCTHFSISSKDINSEECSLITMLVAAKNVTTLAVSGRAPVELRCLQQLIDHFRYVTRLELASCHPQLRLAKCGELLSLRLHPAFGDRVADFPPKLESISCKYLSLLPFAPRSLKQLEGSLGSNLDTAVKTLNSLTKRSMARDTKLTTELTLASINRALQHELMKIHPDSRISLFVVSKDAAQVPRLLFTGLIVRIHTLAPIAIEHVWAFRLLPRLETLYLIAAAEVCEPEPLGPHDWPRLRNLTIVGSTEDAKRYRGLFPSAVSNLRLERPRAARPRK